MSKEIICCWCGEKMMYSVLGQNLTSSHFCDNVDCKAFQMVLPDNLWKDIFAWNQSQRDLDCAKQALEDIKKVCEGCRWCDSNLYDPTPHDGRRIAETTNKAIAQITHDNKDE